MQAVQRKGVAAVSAMALVLGLAACGERSDDRVGAVGDPAASRAERSGGEPRERAGAAREEARTPARDGTASAAADSLDRAREDTRAMGAAAADKARALGAAAADSTRAIGAAAATKVDDGTITAKVNAALAADKELAAIRIDVDTQNGVVTLSGPAPTAAAKQRASEVAQEVKGVASVNNQLTIKAG